MKKIIATLIFATALSAVRAQTNLPVRALSLQDCIEEAVRHNFDVQVARYTPQIDLYNLYGVYGGYDPSFSLTGQHEYSVNPGSLTDNQLQYPSSVGNQDVFGSTLAGVLPWGLQYSLDGSLNNSQGNYPGISTNGVPFSTPYRSTTGQIGINMTQPLLKNFWIDSTRLQIKAAKNNLKYSEQGLRAQLITSVAAIETAYYELIYANENLQVQQEALALAQTQLDQDRQRMQIGTLAQLSVEQDESQVAQSKANLIAAGFTVVNDENTLKNLITDDYKLWHDVNISPTESLEAAEQAYDLQDSWNKGMTLRPDLLEAQITLEQQGIQLKFDRNQEYPELDLTGSYGYNGAGNVYNDVFAQFRDQDSPFWSYGAKMSIPLSNQLARNTLKSDKVTEKQDLLKLKQIEQNILVEIDNAVKQAQSDYESVGATKQARIYAAAALDAEQKTYAVGKATTFEVLTYQNNLTTARGQEIRALANYEEALSNLAQQEGSTLQHRNIDIEVK
ncbi:MAG: TolC family protein [Verrucomicrobiota bacterium]|jgi:HAE1 family hydrophobic/amphiphilic exporter-1